MATRPRVGWDWAAVTAAVIAALMAGAYVLVIRAQGDPPVAWFLAGLISAAGLSIYGAARTAPWRGVALWMAGMILVVFGWLGILSIGLPILTAGGFALAAAARSRDRIST
jgi:hypothetical protein